MRSLDGMFCMHLDQIYSWNQDRLSVMMAIPRGGPSKVLSKLFGVNFVLGILGVTFFIIDIDIFVTFRDVIGIFNTSIFAFVTKRAILYLKSNTDWSDCL